ncbi:hypothetical protein CRU94_08455 [Arcobacter sp. AHV-9/2010]|uniref:hypothetical protein n=1 Tax=Arcobacter sp. AHV-9/2010 TaxID=2021861 RepID=UPI00100AF1F2|nr:hypothetical protein [Arcobacter sp. CECT 9299]RXJ94475.1 hypothetical protein CRU94_08455 [Arcobacter sp. CECT 9299]
MENSSLFDKLSGKFLTAIIIIVFGMYIIINPSYTKWGTDETANTIIGIICVIFGFIVAIYQIISIYKSYKKDKEN